MSTQTGLTAQVRAPSDFSLYIFKRRDVGNSDIEPADPALPTFAIRAKRKIGGASKLTTLRLRNARGELSVVQGVLDWRSKRIACGSVLQSFEETINNIEGASSLDLEWTWPSGKYTTTHNSEGWAAKRGTQVLATYTSFNDKAFGQNDLATLKFSAEIRNEEKIFLLSYLPSPSMTFNFS